MKEFILRNPIQKLLAVCFAIAIWAFAPTHDKNLTEVKFFVQVSYLNLPKTLEIISDPLQSVSVTVEIPRNELRRIHPSLFQAVIDLEDAIPGKRKYEITRDSLKAPAGVKILEMSPESLTLTFEEIIEKTLPIHPVFIGEPAKGFILKKTTMVPPSVLVHGTVSKLESITQLETRTINIEAINSDLEMLIHIAFPDGVTPVEPKPEYYSAKINIGSEPLQKRFLHIPIGIINQTYVTRINPKHFNVLLKGPRSLMQHFSKPDIQAIIDLQGYKPGNYTLRAKEIRLRLPPEIMIQKIWPPIRIWVKKQTID